MRKRVLTGLITCLFVAGIAAGARFSMQASKASLKENTRARLTQVMEDYRSGAMEYEVAFEEIDLIRQMHIPELTTQLSGARRELESLNDSRIAFHLAEFLVQSGDFVGAMEQYKKVSDDDPIYSEQAKEGADKSLAEYRKQVLDTAAEFAVLDDYVNALKALNSSLKVVGNDPQINQMIGLYQQQHEQALVDDVIAQVDELVAQKKFDEAVEQVNEALAEFPNHSDLLGKLDDIEESRFVNLLSLKAVNSNRWMVGQGLSEDSLGNSYPEAMPFVVGHNKAYAEYFVNQQYTHLEGIAAPHRDISQDATVQLILYADDKMIYASEEIGRTSAPVAFRIDIADAKIIRLEVVATGRWLFRVNSLLLGDLVLKR